MKILHVLDHSLPLHSGYTFRSENIFKCQQQIGFHVAVVTSSKHEKSWKQDSPARETINGITYHRSGALSGIQLPFLAEWKLIRQLKDTIIAVCEKEKPDILHAHSPVLNAFAALGAGKELGIPVVYEIRAFWEDAAVDHGTYKELSAKYRLVRFLETRACKQVSKVFTICQGLRNDLIGRGIASEKIGVIPNAIDPENFVPVVRTEENMQRWGLNGAFVLGFVGSFYHYEGLDLLLEATAKLKNSIPDLKVILVGGGPMEESLKNQTKNLRIENNVIFTGRLPHDEMPVMYSLLDALVLPRKSMRLTELVTPLKPLESMCMKKVVIASNVGGHKELIRDEETGYLFKAGSVDSLAEKINELYSAREKWPVVIERAHQWAITDRLWKNNARTYDEIYNNL